MFIYFKHRKESILFSAFARLLVCALSISLIFSPCAVQAQSVIPTVLNLPVPGTMVTPSPAFVPVLLKGMTIHPDDPLRFDFIIDSGNTRFTADEVKQESEKLVKYFLAAMTVPKDDLWVNLSPNEPQRIIPNELGKTELGRDMLAQDYILKQLTASLMYPEEELGKKFWDKVYKEAQERFGTSEIPVNTFNKVWIVPETATIYEHEQTVYVVNAYLKVMLDEDYMAQQSDARSRMLDASGQSSIQHQASSIDDQNSVSTSIIREIIIPAIEREVNQGAHFAPLRQIYHSLILAKWYKETIKNSLLSQVYVDQKLTAGVETDDPTLKDQVYAQYMQAYQKGVFNYIKEDYDRLSQEMIPRKYFSGGLSLDADVDLKRTSNPVVGNGLEGEGWKETVSVAPWKDGAQLSLTDNKEGVESDSKRSSSPIEDEIELPKVDLQEVVENNIVKNIENFLGEDNLKKLNDKFEEKKTALSAEDQKENYNAIDVILKEVNAQRIDKIVDELDVVDQKWIDDTVESDVNGNIKDSVRRNFSNGNIFIEIIAGGQAKRMRDDLRQLEIPGLQDKDFRVWNINLNKIITQIENAKGQLKDEKLRAKFENLKNISNRFVGKLKEYTVGQRILFAISKGIERLTDDVTEQDRIRKQLKVVIHVSKDIQEDVEKDLLDNGFFGFNPKNIILVDGGYGDEFIIEGNQVKRIPQNLTWNHGYAFEQLDWLSGYYIDEFGNRHSTNESVFDYLHDQGARYGLARRINDGILLHPDQAIDWEIFAFLLDQNEKNGANAVGEVMKNPLGTKGGLALTTSTMRPFGMIVEGINMYPKSIQDKLDELIGKRGRIPIPYNRFYIAYKLNDARKAVREKGGLPLTLKYGEEFDINGKSIGMKLTPEIPTGDLTQLNGIQTILAQRKNDFLIDQKIIPEDIAYEPGKGALIHDYKDASHLPMVTELAGYLDNKYDIDTFKSELRARGQLVGAASSPIYNKELEMDAKSYADGFVSSHGVTVYYGNEDYNVGDIIELGQYFRLQTIIKAYLMGENVENTTVHIWKGKEVGAPYDKIYIDVFDYLAEKNVKRGSKSSSPINNDDVGGIDMNDITVDRQGSGVDIQFDPVKVQQVIDLGIDGFAPVIINMTPLPSVLPLLGLEPSKEEESLAVAG